jgi:hypothetical protein
MPLPLSTLNKLRVSLRRIRVAYVKNQLSGKHKPDTGQLAEFDKQLGALDAQAKRVSPVR